MLYAKIIGFLCDNPRNIFAAIIGQFRLQAFGLDRASLKM
jgi:hypothetical protein